MKSTIFLKALELAALIFQKIPWQPHLEQAHTDVIRNNVTHRKPTRQ